MIQLIPMGVIATYNVVSRALRQRRAQALASVEKEIDRLSLAIGMALMFEPTSRDPQYADFKHHLRVAERDLARQKRLQAKLKRKLEN